MSALTRVSKDTMPLQGFKIFQDLYNYSGLEKLGFLVPTWVIPIDMFPPIVGSLKVIILQGD